MPQITLNSPIPTQTVTQSTQTFTATSVNLDAFAIDGTPLKKSPPGAPTSVCTITPFAVNPDGSITWASQSVTVKTSNVYAVLANPKFPATLQFFGAMAAMLNEQYEYQLAQVPLIAAAQTALTTAQAALSAAQANATTVAATGTASVADAALARNTAFTARNAVASTDPSYAGLQAALVAADQAWQAAQATAAANNTTAQAAVATAQTAATAAQAALAAATSKLDPANA